MEQNIMMSRYLYLRERETDWWVAESQLAIIVKIVPLSSVTVSQSAHQIFATATSKCMTRGMRYEILTHFDNNRFYVYVSENAKHNFWIFSQVLNQRQSLVRCSQFSHIFKWKNCSWSTDWRWLNIDKMLTNVHFQSKTYYVHLWWSTSHLFHTYSDRIDVNSETKAVF